MAGGRGDNEKHQQTSSPQIKSEHLVDLNNNTQDVVVDIQPGLEPPNPSQSLYHSSKLASIHEIPSLNISIITSAAEGVDGGESGADAQDASKTGGGTSSRRIEIKPHLSPYSDQSVSGSPLYDGHAISSLSNKRQSVPGKKSSLTSSQSPPPPFDTTTSNIFDEKYSPPKSSSSPSSFLSKNITNSISLLGQHSMLRPQTISASAISLHKSNELGPNALHQLSNSIMTKSPKRIQSIDSIASTDSQGRGRRAAIGSTPTLNRTSETGALNEPEPDSDAKHLRLSPNSDERIHSRSRSASLDKQYSYDPMSDEERTKPSRTSVSSSDRIIRSKSAANLFKSRALMKRHETQYHEPVLDHYHHGTRDSSPKRHSIALGNFPPPSVITEQGLELSRFDTFQSIVSNPGDRESSMSWFPSISRKTMIATLGSDDHVINAGQNNISALDLTGEEQNFLTFHPEERLISLKHVRSAYCRSHHFRKLQLSTPGASTHSIKFWTMLHRWTDHIRSIIKGPKRLIILYFLDLAVDALFCIMYLVEAESNSNHIHDPVLRDLSPRWLYVYRPPNFFAILVVLSILTIASAMLRLVAFTDRKAVPSALFSMVQSIDLIISLPFIVLAFYAIGPNIYIPYFIKAVTLVDKLKKVLRLRSAWAVGVVDSYRERIAILVATILAILYGGLCAFQYVQMLFAPEGPISFTLMKGLYFIVVTMATVGYGDIVPNSTAGEIVVIILILMALGILPVLISNVAETFFLQRKGGGSYMRGSIPFVVVCGTFTNAYRVLDVLNVFLAREFETQTKVVILSRGEASNAVKTILYNSTFKNMVTYLQGNALNYMDMKRADIRHASAVFIVGDRNAADPKVEDEHNILRAWAFDDFAPMTPLYVYNLRPETESFIDKMTTAALCVQDIKQIFLAYNCLYRGAGTLMLNMIHEMSSMPHSEDEPWKSQYGDGASSGIFTTKINPLFVGHSFAALSWYLYRQLQVIVFAVRVRIEIRNEWHLMLNPGSVYTFRPTDEIVLIAHTTHSVKSVQNLTEAVFASTFDFKMNDVAAPVSSPSGNSYSTHSGSSPKTPQLAGKTFSAETVMSYAQSAGFPYRPPDFWIAHPSPPYQDSKVPLCRLLKSSCVDIFLKQGTHLKRHVLVCTGTYEVFKFICTLRSVNLVESEFKTILFLCPEQPSQEEIAMISVFPNVYVMMGDPKRRVDLLKAGIRGADKVVIMNMLSPKSSTDGVDDDDEFSDSNAIMVSHLIYNIFQQSTLRKYVIVEVQKREHVKFIRPTARKGRKSKRKRTFGKIAAPSYSSEEDMSAFNYIFAPVYAAGRVLVVSMLDSILFQTFHHSSLLEIVNYFCGMRYQRDIELDTLLGVSPTCLCYIDLPPDFEGSTFAALYKELALNHGIIPLGILRDNDNPDFGNVLPFVYTSPLPSLILRKSDLIYVLTVVKALA